MIDGNPKPRRKTKGKSVEDQLKEHLEKLQSQSPIVNYFGSPTLDRGADSHKLGHTIALLGVLMTAIFGAVALGAYFADDVGEAKIEHIIDEKLKTIHEDIKKQEIKIQQLENLIK